MSSCIRDGLTVNGSVSLLMVLLNWFLLNKEFGVKGSPQLGELRRASPPGPILTSNTDPLVAIDSGEVLNVADGGGVTELESP